MCRTAKAGREAEQADALAAAHEKIGGGEAEHERPIDFWLQRELGGKPHGGGAVDPNINRMRRLPFPLAHIEALVLGRAAPIDAARRFARDERAKLPEGLAGARAPAPMDAMHDARRNLFRTRAKAGKPLRQFQRMVLVAAPGAAFIFVQEAGP